MNQNHIQMLTSVLLVCPPHRIRHKVKQHLDTGSRDATCYLLLSVASITACFYHQLRTEQQEVVPPSKPPPVWTWHPDTGHALRARSVRTALRLNNPHLKHHLQSLTVVSAVPLSFTLCCTAVYKLIPHISQGTDHWRFNCIMLDSIKSIKMKSWP